MTLSASTLLFFHAYPRFPAFSPERAWRNAEHARGTALVAPGPFQSLLNMAHFHVAQASRIPRLFSGPVSFHRELHKMT